MCSKQTEPQVGKDDERVMSDAQRRMEAAQRAEFLKRVAEQRNDPQIDCALGR